MKEENNKLWQENREFRDHVQQQPVETTSLAPQQMLSHVKKTLRKLGGDSTGSVIANSFSQTDSNDENNKSKSGKKDYVSNDLILIMVN